MVGLIVHISGHYKSDSNGLVSYFYDAAGGLHQTEKKKNDQVTKRRVYIDAAEYLDEVIDQIHTSAGYVEPVYALPAEIYRTTTETYNDTYTAIKVLSDATVPNTISVIYEGGAFINLLKGFTVDLGGALEARIVDMPVIGLMPVYVLKDHLGSARVLFADINGNHSVDQSEILTSQAFYPFGGLHTDNGEQPTKFKHLFTGQERQKNFEMGYDRFFSRFSDPWIGRFLSPDKYAAKYASMNPYQYRALSPIKYIDVNGDSLQVAFQNEEARQAFINVANQGLEGQFQVNISDNGIVTFDPTDGGGDASKLSEIGQAYYNSTSKVLNSGKIVSIKADFGNSGVHTGHFNSGTIDMADILQFNENPQQLGGTQLGKLTHEIVEQGEKQLYGSGFNGAHSTAIAAENKVNNSIRTDSRQYIRGGAIQSFSRGDKTVNTMIKFTQPGGWRNLWFDVNRKEIKVTNR